MPFRFTINAYRGCAHACTYCFARPTHEFLGMNAGEDFERRIVVKVNAVEKLRRELREPRWAGDHIAMGTNTDPYQPAEGRYRLTRGIIEALGEARNEFSILTKSPMIVRDLDVLVAAAGAHARPLQPLDRHGRRGRLAGQRAGHAAAPAAHRGGAAAEPRRASRAASWSLRSCRASPTTPTGSRPSSRRCSPPVPSRSRRSSSTCGPACATSSCRGWPATGPTSSSATASSTRARTHPRRRPARASSSRSWCESTGGVPVGPGGRADGRRASGAGR